MRVYLGADHAGYDVKNHLVTYLRTQGHEVTDIGPCHYDADDDYPSFCIETARRVLNDEGSLGVVIGGSGNGEQIAANKVPGVRAALAWNPETAELARQHNFAQVIGIGARMHSLDEAERIVDTFLATPISHEARHGRRVDQLLDYERTGVPPVLPQS